MYLRSSSSTLLIVNGLDVSLEAEDHVSDFNNEEGGTLVLNAVIIFSTNGLHKLLSTNILSPTASSTYS